MRKIQHLEHSVFSIEWHKQKSVHWVIRDHYCDVIMSPTASQITSLTIVYSIVYSGTDQRKHQSSASLAFVRGIHRRPVNSPHKWPVTRKMFLFDDVIMFRKCPVTEPLSNPISFQHSKCHHIARDFVGYFENTVWLAK